MNKNLDKYVKKAKVDLTDFLGESHFIEVKEPSTGDLKVFFRVEKCASKISDENGMSELLDAMQEIGNILPELIVDHDFFNAEKVTEKLPVKEVAGMLANKFDCLQYITQELMKLLPLPRGSVKK